MTQSSHITRIFGTNKNGDILPDMWVDVERIHEISYDTVQGSHYQKVTQYLVWADDPEDSSNYMLESDAKVVRKICSPDEEKLDDPEEWVPVKVISQMKFDNQGMTLQHTFRVDAASSPDARRIVHYDTNLDDIAQSWAEKEGRKAYVMMSEEYKPDRKTKDDGQYIEEQIINSFQVNADRVDSVEGQDQKVSVYIQARHPLIDDEADPAPDAKLEDKRGEDDLNPPYVLDPYQAIINVQMGSATKILFGASEVCETPPVISGDKITISFAIFVPDIPKGIPVYADIEIATWGMTPKGDNYSDGSEGRPARPNRLRVTPGQKDEKSGFDPSLYGITLELVDVKLHASYHGPREPCVLPLHIRPGNHLKRNCWNHVLFTVDLSKTTKRATLSGSSKWSSSGVDQAWDGATAFRTWPVDASTPGPGPLFVGSYQADGFTWGRYFFMTPTHYSQSNAGAMTSGKIAKCWVNGTKVKLVGGSETYGDAGPDMFSESPGAIVEGPNGAPMTTSTSGGPFGFPLPPKKATQIGDDGVRFAAVQMWFNKLADGPELFVKEDEEGNKIMLRPNVSQKKLGKSDLLLDGGPASFKTNRNNKDFTFKQSDEEDFESVKYPRKLNVPEPKKTPAPLTRRRRELVR